MFSLTMVPRKISSAPNNINLFISESMRADEYHKTFVTLICHIDDNIISGKYSFGILTTPFLARLQKKIKKHNK